MNRSPSYIEPAFTDGGEVQVARRAPCAFHTAEPAGGITIKCSPESEVPVRFSRVESTERFN